MKLIDNTHPFYRKAWRRWLIIGICAFWCAFEFATGTPFWGILAGALAVYCWHVLIRTFPEGEGEGEGGA